MEKIYVWPDGTWCYHEDLDVFLTYMSDDYVVRQARDDLHAEYIAEQIFLNGGFHFRSQADEYAARATFLEKQITDKEHELSNLNDQIKTLRDDLESAVAKTRDLQEKLNRERSAHEVSRIHMEDEREHLRSAVIHRLNKEFSLLSEGLLALRKDPPRISVMDDHAERVLEGMRRSIDDLKEEG